MIQYNTLFVEDIAKLRLNLLHLSKKHEVFSILDSNDWPNDQYHTYDLLAAFGSANDSARDSQAPSFQKLRNEYNSYHDWIFACLSYDLKNELEDLHSANFDAIEFPNIQFFTPKYLFILKGNKLEILIHKTYINNPEIINEIESVFSEKAIDEEFSTKQKSIIKHRINKEQYIEALSQIKQHIKRGDIYELNYCQEFYVENIEIEPSAIFKKLIKKSPTPFSAFVRFNDLFVLSASPERFLKKEGSQIISQPIKGTARRHADKTMDAEAKLHLQKDIKERAENIMIVDLVRNDLAHTAKKGSVKVQELCEIYSFKQVHQMISTISCQLDDKYDLFDTLEQCFPMGSMTGAPKYRAMELIEKYEFTKRGIYSGAIGYITPEGDFDFNVVIRSLIYNQSNKYLSFIAGGAITFQSELEKEYEESLLKAEAIREILS